MRQTKVPALQSLMLRKVFFSFENISIHSSFLLIVFSFSLFLNSFNIYFFNIAAINFGMKLVTTFLKIISLLCTYVLISICLAFFWGFPFLLTHLMKLITVYIVCIVWYYIFELYGNIDLTFLM